MKCNDCDYYDTFSCYAKPPVQKVEAAQLELEEWVRPTVGPNDIACVFYKDDTVDKSVSISL